MTIDELKEKKDKLETALLDLIQGFENETRLKIERIESVSVHGGSSAYGYTADINIEIKL